MKSIVELAKEKVKARREEFDALKAKADDADVLVADLEKVKDRLPKAAKDALDRHKKAGKKK